MVRFEERGGTEEASREATPSQVARLLIADDHALVREGLRTMLSGEDGIEVVAEAQDGQQALALCRELGPDLVLMDVRMPVMDGLEATRKIKQEMPKTSVMMVTMHENPDYLFEAVKAGAAGYVLKDASGERLLGAVRRTLEGESPLNQELAMRLLVRLSRESSGSGEGDGRGSEEGSGGAFREAAEETTGQAQREGESLSSQPEAHQAGPSGSGQWRGAEQIESLTPREVEVLRLLSQGQTNPQIAQNLLVSRGTVKIHVQHIISKLGVSDRTQAAVRAIEAGLLGVGTRR
ncbi:MAG: response regulator transcription factor [Actinomycetota bacterium]|jgi:DNA-binding NarL/FixJ family response regulator|nr:response regulator transcription factor [Actinomycetota bacterium]